MLSSTEMIQWIISPNTRLHKSPVIYELNVATQNKTSKKLQNYTAEQSLNIITLTNKYPFLERPTAIHRIGTVQV